MAEEFDHLPCPICGSELVYSEGTHDLGCLNNPRPLESTSSHTKKSLHEEVVSYSVNNKGKHNKHDSHKPCDHKQFKSEDNYMNVCELSSNTETSQIKTIDKHDEQMCVFGISFTESANKGTLWSIRIVDGETNYAALMRLMQNIENRVGAKQPLAANVPNLPRKIERTKATKLAFRYNLEIEDLYSIKYSTETIDRLALFYNLTNKEVRHIKQSDILEE